LIFGVCFEFNKGKMKKILVFCLVSLLVISSFGQDGETKFAQIYDLIERDNYFMAKEIYDLQKDDLPKTYQLVTEVFLDNAFNRLAESDNKISSLVNSENNLPDSLILKLYQVKVDNAIKLFDYKEAKKSLEFILRNFRTQLADHQKAEFENSLKIWKALENEPGQKVSINETNRMKMGKDRAGFNNLEIFNDLDTTNFIFDTGANLSTVPESTAKSMGMKILSADLEVGTITGAKVPAKLAVCPEINLGNIEIQNAVFLVLNDSALSFPQIGYKIYGVLGFPVMEALREIQITRDGWFIVPEEQTRIDQPSNMAMNGLTPLIYIDGKHYSFDTGADNTQLYQLYYLENKSEIDENNEPARIRFGGAGGERVFDGFIISPTFDILGRDVTLNDIHLLKEKVKETETVYGNIGQDLIRQFNKMTINFSRMFIKFD
jgi:predicted aspartyl protease